MAKQQKVVIQIPKGYSSSQRQQIAFDIIEQIQRRTSRGIDKDGNRFASYTPEYAKEKGSKKVDLFLEGDMMVQLTLLTHRTGSVTIGYPSGDDINDKVEGNRLGTYGQSSPIQGKARDFLGITEQELSRILENYKPEFGRELEEVEQINDPDFFARLELGE